MFALRAKQPRTMAAALATIAALWVAGMGATYYTQNGHVLNEASKPAAPAPLGGGDGVTLPQYLSGTWSYGGAGGANSNMWTADDFIVKGADGKERVWQNYMLVCCKNGYDFYASQWTQIYQRTGYKLFVFWGYDHWNTLNDVQAFTAAYANLTTYYPELPPQPSGIFLYDEPSNTQMDGAPSVYSLVNLTSVLKQTYPNAPIYANFLWNTITDPHYTALMGNSSLDYISSDQYSTPWKTYKAQYASTLYPYLKPTQKVLILPETTYTAPSGQALINPVFVDQLFLYSSASSVTNYYNWMVNDRWVYGFVTFYLKNVFTTNPANMTLLTSPNPVASPPQACLVDRLDRTPGSPYVAPNTVRYYQQLGLKWAYDGNK